MWVNHKRVFEIHTKPEPIINALRFLAVHEKQRMEQLVIFFYISHDIKYPAYMRYNEDDADHEYKLLQGVQILGVRVRGSAASTLAVSHEGRVYEAATKECIVVNQDVQTAHSRTGITWKRT